MASMTTTSATSSTVPSLPTGIRAGVARGLSRDHLRVDQRRGDGVDGDALLGQQRGIRVRQAVDARLGRRVVRADHAARLRGDGG